MPKEKRYSAQEIIEKMKAHFGSAAKAYWFYDGELCPSCMSTPVGEAVKPNQKELSINAYMYRERGTMIAYHLCMDCAVQLMSESPQGPMDLHKALEKNLIDAYLRYLKSLT